MINNMQDDLQPIQPSKKQLVATYIKSRLYNIFITGLSAMAQGLFATLIVGTIICQIAMLIPGVIGYYLNAIGVFAKLLMGAGIGFAVAKKFDCGVLVAVSCGVVGFLGAFAGKIIDQGVINGSVITLVGVGEPLGAFIGSYFACFIGKLVSGKTKVDILVTPICCIIGGCVLALLIGSPISGLMSVIGDAINFGTEQQPVWMGIIVSSLMGICLTLPISSAAIGISLQLSGLAAGAAVVGCCCQMVGFATVSFQDNKWSGVFSQGLGTSMLQMPNIIRKPIIWAPPIIASIILGPLSTTLFGITSNAVGSGMGTAGLVGPIMTITTMIAAGEALWIVLLKVISICIILPALLTYGIYFIFVKCKLISKGDMLLQQNS